MKGRKREIAGRKCPNDSEWLLKIGPHALKIVWGVKKNFRGVKKIFHTLQKIFYTPQKIFVTQQRIFLSIFLKSDFQLAITIIWAFSLGYFSYSPFYFLSTRFSLAHLIDASTNFIKLWTSNWIISLRNADLNLRQTPLYCFVKRRCIASKLSPIKTQI